MISNVNGKKIIQYLKMIEFSHAKSEKKNKKKKYSMRSYF